MEPFSLNECLEKNNIAPSRTLEKHLAYHVKIQECVYSILFQSFNMNDFSDFRENQHRRMMQKTLHRNGCDRIISKFHSSNG